MRWWAALKNPEMVLSMLSHNKRVQNDLNPAANPWRTQAPPKRLRWRPQLSFAASVVVIAWLVHPAFGNPAQVTNLFQPLSQPAQEIKEVSLLVLAICAAIFLIVVGLLVYAIVRFRHRPGDEASEPPQVYGSNQIELAWTVLPILIVFVLILVTSRTIADIQNRKPPPGAVQATVVGHQWWWEIRYPELGIVTANELHVPASTGNSRQPTFLKLQSADVAHSFWVPQLAGKTDLIPNRENRMWIEPTNPGIYLGNCAEYCGTQHARMLIRVVVQSPDEFDRWVRDQQQATSPATNAAEGRKAFLANSCINCHTIRGTSARGKFGPDLTHLMSRETLAAGVVPNTADNLRLWVRDPQKIKVGCLMPNMQMTDQEVDQLVAYLETLK
ncbi:MAG TPA: cytochrome c oxidase subunit II [Pyrinomonadaceae bacterium]|nr:cytochrome c oxidase subunit II [Pyrinomonadaceae bacterium]